MIMLKSNKFVASAALVLGLLAAILFGNVVNGDSTDVQSKQLLFDGEVSALEWLGKDTNILILITSMNQAWRSGDAGNTWTLLNDQLETLSNAAGGDPVLKAIQEQAATPVAPPQAGAAAAAGQKSGFNFMKPAAFQEQKAIKFGITDVIGSKAEPNNIFLVGLGAHSFSSTDGGVTWQLSVVKPKDPEELNVLLDVTLHPTNGQYVLASTMTQKCGAGVLPTKSFKLPCRKSLWQSKDFGKNWEKLQDYVVQYNWLYAIGEDNCEGQPEQAVLSTVHTEQSGDQRFGFWDTKIDLVRSDDSFRSKKVLVYGGNRFLFTGSFIFVAAYAAPPSLTSFIPLPGSAASLLNSNMKGSPPKVVLQISDDGGKTFRHGKVPQTMQHAYTVLDSSEDTVFIHVNQESSAASYGHVYISDATGFNFSLSLPVNRRDAKGKCDFDKVAGLEGIYIANYIDNIQEIEDWEKNNRLQESDEVATNGNAQFQQRMVKAGAMNSETNPFGNVDQSQIGQKGFSLSNKITTGSQVNKFSVGKAKKAVQRPRERLRTVITHDKGGIWGFIRPPVKDAQGRPIQCDDSDCSLHLNGITGEFGPFYSTATATGLIMATGNVGSELAKMSGAINTYFSRDAGLNWEEVRKGSRIYEFGDHGGLIVMADDANPTDTLEFSWTEGAAWLDFKFATSDKMVIENIMTEPTSTARRFVVYGTQKSYGGKTQGVLYSVDFSNYHQRECKGVDSAGAPESDYEIWSPSDGRYEDKCLLGHKVEITRRKRDAACFNPEEHERKVMVLHCPCTDADYECDIGYFRKIRNGPCVRDPSVVFDKSLLIPEYCPTGGKYTVSNGYRKIAGDTCLTTNGGVDRLPDEFPCPGGLFGVSYTGWFLLFVFVAGMYSLLKGAGGGSKYQFPGGQMVKENTSKPLGHVNRLLAVGVGLLSTLLSLFSGLLSRGAGAASSSRGYAEVGKDNNGVETADYEDYYNDDELGGDAGGIELDDDEGMGDAELLPPAPTEARPLPKVNLPTNTPVPLLSAPPSASPAAVQPKTLLAEFDDGDAV